MRSIYVADNGWDSIYSLQAPLKIATAGFQKLNQYYQQGKAGYFSNLVGAKPVSFNKTFVSAVADNDATYNSVVGGVGSYISAGEFTYMFGGAGANSGTTAAALQNINAVAKNSIQDFVFYVTFRTLGEYIATHGNLSATPAYTVSGYDGKKAVQYSKPFVKVNVDSAGNYSVFEELKETYKDWVLPFVDVYILDEGQGLPRTKVKIKPTFFAPFASNILHYIEPSNLPKSEFYRWGNPLVYGISAGYVRYDDSYMLGYSNILPYEVTSFMYLSGMLNTFFRQGEPITPYKTILLLDNYYYTRFNSDRMPLWGVQPFSDCKIVSGEKPVFNPMHIFKTKEDALNYYRDFGITVTEDLETATQLPPEDITPPSGNTDPPVTEIPSYPDNTSDTIEIITPDYTASSFGQCKVYTPTTTEPLIKWFGENTFWQDINRLFADPINAVFGLRLYNLDIVLRDNSHVTLNEATKILNVSTAISCYSILNGYNTIVNGGSYQYTAYYGNFADFLNATYDIFIPYVGIRRLNPSDVVNRLLELKYAVDFATGNATVFLLSDSKLIMTTSCNISAEIPIQTSNINDVNFQTLMGVLTGAVSGGKSGFVSGAKSGNIAGAVGGAVGGAVVGGALSGFDNYLNNIEHGYQGSVSGNNAFGMLEPFLIIRRFPIANTGNYSNLYGLKNASTVTFSSLTSGYIQADTVEINTRATDRERNEIIALLKQGVHLR